MAVQASITIASSAVSGSRAQSSSARVQGMAAVSETTLPAADEPVSAEKGSAAAAYDGIADTYTEVRGKSNPKDLFELLNVESVLAPLIHGKRLLELACGSGFYSFDLLSWGAESVVAVDNSPALLSLARSAAVWFRRSFDRRGKQQWRRLLQQQLRVVSLLSPGAACCAPPVAAEESS